MIINLNQTSSNFSKVIEVEESESITANIQMPLISKYSSTTMNSKGEHLYSTHFQVVNEIKNSIPFKWLWSEQVTEACIVKDRTETIIGLIQNIRKEALLSYYEVKIRDENLKIYEVTKKHIVHLLIFYENRQIGQIEKSLKRKNNLDRYVLFLLDEYTRFKDILILFVGYFDNWNYSEIGEVVALKREVAWEWSYSKANSKYDKHWIQQNFNLSEEHKAAINNEQMSYLFILIFVVTGLLGLTVIVFFIVQH